jgi:purine nucleoside permease
MHNKKLSALIGAVVLSGTMLFASPAQKIPVKVLVLDMFEVGKNEGDFAGEFQHYYERYFTTAAPYSFGTQPFTLYVNKDGIAGCVTGMGKAQAASTLTAILSDGRFDFSQAYILVSGCGGMPPARGTLGDVVIADTLVDYELGHAWTESDIPAGTTATFMRDKSYDRAACIPLNSALVKWAYAQTAGLTLTDDAKAAAYRALYSSSEAQEKPAVRIGSSVTGDNYWHGTHASLHADEVCAAYGTSPYLVTQMEDNGFGVAALNYGKLDRLIVTRDIVNYDQPHGGQSVTESLAASSGAFSMGMTNGFIVGSAIIDALITNWKTVSVTIPQAK